jgi:hypothetical protein
MLICLKDKGNIYKMGKYLLTKNCEHQCNYNKFVELYNIYSNNEITVK